MAITAHLTGPTCRRSRHRWSRTGGQHLASPQSWLTTQFLWRSTTSELIVLFLSWEDTWHNKGDPARYIQKTLKVLRFQKSQVILNQRWVLTDSSNLTSNKSIPFQIWYKFVWKLETPPKYNQILTHYSFERFNFQIKPFSSWPYNL